MPANRLPYLDFWVIELSVLNVYDLRLRLDKQTMCCHILSLPHD